MNRKFSACIASLFGLLLSATASLAYADPADFVDEASAKGIAEIETAKVVLEKGTAQDVKSFAQMMIDDHTMANQKLKALAQQKQLKVSDDATLMDKAKKMILQWREGENFDQAYANNQVTAHEQTIELFREQAQKGEDADIKAFASETLPKLEEHLRQAKELAATHGGDTDQGD
jgi:putative membrane protein